jgi:hypothetical protein
MPTATPRLTNYVGVIARLRTIEEQLGTLELVLRQEVDNTNPSTKAGKQAREFHGCVTSLLEDLQLNMKVLTRARH